MVHPISGNHKKIVKHFNYTFLWILNTVKLNIVIRQMEEKIDKSRIYMCCLVTLNEKKKTEHSDYCEQFTNKKIIKFNKITP